MRRRRKTPAALNFEAVAELCASVLIEPPPEHYRHDAVLLMCKQRQAETKRRQWAKARTRKRDYREMQANDDTREP